jgi:SAM-dependent methyltransferase
VTRGALMETDFARQYYEAAQTDHWWFQGRSELVKRLLAREGSFEGLALDLGAGSETLFPTAFEVVKLDIVRPEGSLSSFVQGSALDLPFRSESFRAVGAFDLIEHVVATGELLAEVARVLAPGGLVLATVPAYQWLWSPHDERVGHVRRYERDDVSSLISAAGLRMAWCEHFYGFLIPPALVRKVLGLSTTMGNPGPRTNRALSAMSRASVRRALQRRKPGLSIGLAAVKT